MQADRRHPLLISLVLFSLAGCGSKQDPDKGKVGSLPDLPEADIHRLKIVPDSKVAATRRPRVQCGQSGQPRPEPETRTTPPSTTSA